MTFDEFINKVENTFNTEGMRKCECNDPMCTLYFFDNGFSTPIERIPNVVYIDFVTKKRL